LGSLAGVRLPASTYSTELYMIDMRNEKGGSTCIQKRRFCSVLLAGNRGVFGRYTRNNHHHHVEVTMIIIIIIIIILCFTVSVQYHNNKIIITIITTTTTIIIIRSIIKLFMNLHLYYF
jgi:hypothetical protein